MKVKLFNKLGVHEAVGPDNNGIYCVLLDNGEIVQYTDQAVTIVSEPTKPEFNIKDLALLNPKRVTLEF